MAYLPYGLGTKKPIMPFGLGMAPPEGTPTGEMPSVAPMPTVIRSIMPPPAPYVLPPFPIKSQPSQAGIDYNAEIEAMFAPTASGMPTSYGTPGVPGSVPSALNPSSVTSSNIIRPIPGAPGAGHGIGPAPGVGPIPGAPGAGHGIGPRPPGEEVPNPLDPPPVDVPTPEFDQALFDMLLGAGSDIGMNAYNMALNGIGPVRDVNEWSSILNSITPNMQSLLAPNSYVKQAQQMMDDQYAQYGLLGLPVSAINEMASRNMAQVNLAQTGAEDALARQMSATGQFGQGAMGQAIVDQSATQYAPARVEAISAPWELAYQMGPELAKLVSDTITGVELPLAQMSQTGNLTDLQRQQNAYTQAAQLYEQGAMGGLTTGAGTAMDMTGLTANMSLAEQQMIQQQWATMFNTLTPLMYQSQMQQYEAQMQAQMQMQQMMMQLIMAAFTSGQYVPGPPDTMWGDAAAAIGQITSQAVGSIAGGGGGGFMG